MELRSYNHLHFFHAIKGGSVIKLLNVMHGRPVLKFKKIGEVYEAEDAKHDDSVPMPRLEDGLLFDPNKVKLESQSLPFADRSTIISDLDASDSNCCMSDKESSDSDDISFCNTTLKQIKESCKTRKRKQVKCVNLSKGLIENCLPLKRDYIKFEPEEDEDDLEQPLSNWKLKILKNKKLKKKCIRNDTLTSSQSAIAIVKSETFSDDQNFLQPKCDLPSPIDATVEVNELNCFDCQIMTRITADSSFDFNEPVDYRELATDKVPVTVSECDLVSSVSMSSTEEQCCVVNEAFYECMECPDPESVNDEEVSGWEIVNVDCPEIISYDFPDFPATEFEDERDIIHPLLDIIPPQPIYVIKDLNSYSYDIDHGYSSSDHISWPLTSSDDQVQGLEMEIDNRLQCTEIIDVDGLCLLEDNTKVDLPSYTEASTISPANDCVIDNRLQCMEIIDVDGKVLLENRTTDDLPSYQEASTGSPVSDCGCSQNSDSLPSPDKPSVSADEDSPLAEDKQPPLSACAFTVRNCSSTFHPFDATEELTTPSDDGVQHSKLVCHPERLFSTRKVISPTSQERLRKAMQTNELLDEENSECRGKLWFGKQTENTVVKAEGCYKIRRAGATNNMKQVLWRPKYDKKGSPSRGILKGHHSSAIPSLSTRCTSSGSLSQSAIAFSQRQMQDIESLATKLTGELSSMKDVVNELLHSQAIPATSLKHNMDKVTMAIKNASKAEETARRWLSIMARDCNRFCKIMNLTERGSTASENVVHKHKKRITFADEAGGKLCHVRFFNDDMDSEQESSYIEK